MLLPGEKPRTFCSRACSGREVIFRSCACARISVIIVALHQELHCGLNRLSRVWGWPATLLRRRFMNSSPQVAAVVLLKHQERHHIPAIPKISKDPWTNKKVCCYYWLRIGQTSILCRRARWGFLQVPPIVYVSDSPHSQTTLSSCDFSANTLNKHRK